ncbi:MAG: histidine phosphatase family protein [Pseudobdellovibrionaceae bacterium]|jgi:broad specificity phosphatase PhoE
MRLFYMIRHGETDWNQLGKFQGHTNRPLNEQGFAQAKSLAPLLLPKAIDLAISSDLLRAHQTAQASFQGTILVDARLREANLGEAEGLTYEEVEQLVGSEALQLWRSPHRDTYHVGLPGGETKKELAEKMRTALTHYLEAHSEKTLAFFSHGMVIRNFIHWIEPEIPQTFGLKNCTIVPVHYLGSGQFAYQGPHDPELLERP